MEIEIDDLKRIERPCQSAADTCVYKVPEDKKRMDETAYVPQVAGLGPYHHDANAPANIIQHKKEAVRRALKRIILHEARKESPQQSTVSDGDEEIQAIHLEKVRQRVTNLQPEIAAVYEDRIEFKCDMFLIDTCFFIEVCLTAAFYYDIVDDPINCSSGVYPLFHSTRQPSGPWHSVALDFIKLENQLPFVLVTEVLRLQGYKDSQFNGIFYFFFKAICPLPRCEIREFSSLHVRHLLEWLHASISSYIKINTKEYDYKYVPRLSFPTIEALNKVRIFVKPADEISLKNHVLGLSTILTLPDILLKYPSKIVFRNLIAFEECIDMDDRVITVYLLFLDNLINTKEDATLLRQAGVVDGLFANDQEIADIFNGLTTGCIIPYNNDFQCIADEIRRCYENSKRTNLAEFFDQYCGRPWLIIGVATAIVILVCTLIQTVNSFDH